MARDYAWEYKRYHSKPKQKKRRAQRNTARRKAVRKHGKSALKGKDVHHSKPGNLKTSPTRVVSVKSNRGYRRSASNKNLGLRKKR